MRQPTLISCLPRGHENVAGKLRSYGLSRLLSELGYRDPQPPIIVLAFREFDEFVSPSFDGKIHPAVFGSLLAWNPDYLEATRGDWRRPVVIVAIGSLHTVEPMPNLAPFTSQLLGTSDADRPVYITEDNIPPRRLASPDGRSVVSGGGLKLLTPDRMQPSPPHQHLTARNLRVGVDAESVQNAVCFPVHPGETELWEAWGSLDYDGHGPMLRRAVAEFDPDPLFVCVRVSGGQIEIIRNGSIEPASPDPVELGMLIQGSAMFQLADGPHPGLSSQLADAGQLGRTVVIVPRSENDDAPLPDWYVRALAEGLRRVGGPPRPVFVYDGGYEINADDVEDVFDRLRSVTPELHWRRGEDTRLSEESREFVPRYERDSPPGYESAGEVASAIAAIDRQRAAALYGDARPARPAEVTETEIATVYRRWREDFQEAERALSTLSANRVADLQARARMILQSLWERPRQGDTSSAMAMQNLWDRMAQRVAFRLYEDGQSETAAWANAAAMVATVPSLGPTER